MTREIEKLTDDPQAQAHAKRIEKYRLMIQDRIRLFEPGVVPKVN